MRSPMIKRTKSICLEEFPSAKTMKKNHRKKRIKQALKKIVGRS